MRKSAFVPLFLKVWVWPLLNQTTKGPSLGSRNSSFSLPPFPSVSKKTTLRGTGHSFWPRQEVGGGRLWRLEGSDGPGAGGRCCQGTVGQARILPVCAEARVGMGDLPLVVPLSKTKENSDSQGSVRGGQGPLRPLIRAARTALPSMHPSHLPFPEGVAERRRRGPVCARAAPLLAGPCSAAAFHPPHLAARRTPYPAMLRGRGGAGRPE